MKTLDHRLLVSGLLLLISTLLSGPLSAAEQAISRQEQTINLGDMTLTAWSWGDQNDPLVVALPGSGAANTRYQDLGPLVAGGGYFVVALNQRGINGSTGNLEGLTLHDYANDVVRVIDYFQKSRAHLVGWALGNRIQRMVATDHPQRVASITLLAAGGLVTPTTEPGTLNRLLSDADLPLQEKMALARHTLFAAATDERLVRQFAEQLTYWPAARSAQRAANQAVPTQVWWAGGSSPMLIIQGLEDTTAPAGNGRQMKQTYGDRITLVEIDNAGHLMGFEKPQETADAILVFLADHPV